MKRILKFNFMDGSFRHIEITSASALPNSFSRSLSLQEKKDGKFHLCHSESLVQDFSTVKSIEVVRE